MLVNSIPVDVVGGAYDIAVDYLKRAGRIRPRRIFTNRYSIPSLRISRPAKPTNYSSPIGPFFELKEPKAR